jgi:hypothetical protein
MSSRGKRLSRLNGFCLLGVAVAVVVPFVACSAEDGGGLVVDEGMFWPAY